MESSRDLPRAPVRVCDWYWCHSFFTWSQDIPPSTTHRARFWEEAAVAAAAVGNRALFDAFLGKWRSCLH